MNIGITLAIGQQLGFTVHTTLIHQIGSTIGALWMAMFWCVAAAIIMLPWCVNVGFHIYHRKAMLLRGILTAGYMLTMMWAFSAIPLMDATALSYLTAIWTVALAPLIDERWTLASITAVVLGFAGAMLIIQPTFSEVGPAYIIFALLTALNAGNVLLNRFMQTTTPRDHPAVILFYAALIALVILTPVTLTVPLPQIDQPYLLAATSIVGPVATLLGIIAAPYITASALAPYNYVRLIMVGIIAPLLFAEPVGWLVFAGGAMIVTACVLGDILKMRAQS
jgi:drug/metabolite transporter (DMT)-like permease